jgi:hypothetical protein
MDALNFRKTIPLPKHKNKGTLMNNLAIVLENQKRHK